MADVVKRLIDLPQHRKQTLSRNLSRTNSVLRQFIEAVRQLTPVNQHLIDGTITGIDDDGVRRDDIASQRQLGSEPLQ